MALKILGGYSHTTFKRPSIPSYHHQGRQPWIEEGDSFVLPQEKRRETSIKLERTTHHVFDCILIYD
jgi:hypothetical protein